jgi:hypothetical protein
MTPELKQKWIDALRSGKYQQGRSALRTKDDRFCCLGVLCDIVDPSGWEPPAAGIYAHLGHSGLPDSKFLGDVCGLYAGAAADLSKMNDSGYTFERIADNIRDLYL